MRFDPAKMKEFVPQRAQGGMREVDIILSSDMIALHVGVVVREYRFEPTRRWKFDFCIPKPEVMLACEIEGGGHGVHDKFGRFNRNVKGHHHTAKGFQKDCEKYGHAQALGWTVMRFTTEQVLQGRAREVLNKWKENRMFRLERTE